MQTLLEFRHADTEYIIYKSDRNVGRIAFDFTSHLWEYNPYGESVKAIGTLEQCKAAAEADHKEAQSKEATVTHIASDIKPAYVHRRTSWRTSGSGYEQTITVEQDGVSYKVLVPSGFARQLHIGSVVELHYRNAGGFYLKWGKPVLRRQQLAAA